MKAIYIVCVIALLGAMMVAPAAAADWSTFQKDHYNTGLTSDKAPITNPYGNGISWEKSFAFSGWAGFDEAPVVVGDTVYVVGADNKVRAMNKTTGVVKWETPTSGGGFLLGNMGAGNGMIFVPTSDGKIFGIDDATGVVEWSATESGQMNTPVVYDDHKIYFGDWGGNNAYYCYSDTGTEIWQRTSESGSGYYWAGAATIGDYLVYGDDAGHLTSVYKANGTTVHEIDVSTEFGVTANEIRSSICYVEDLDRIYFTSKGDYIYTLGMNDDGTFDTTDKHHANIGYSTSTPAVYNGKVYVGAGGMYGGNGVSCLDVNLTDEYWHFAAEAGAVQSSPAITTAYDDGDGEVYIYFTTNTNVGKVYCVNESGVEQWSWGESGKTSWTLCGVAISDGWIFYGTDSKYVFGFATNESLLDIPPPAQFTLSVTVDPADSGTVDMDPTGGTYDDGTPVTLTASVAAGYTFSHWSRDLISSVNPETLTMDADKSVTANFVVEAPTPPTSFLISGNVTYDNGNPVMNSAVTVTNLATSEDFTVETDAGSNYYLTLTDSTHVTAGDAIRINASDGTVSNETDHLVTASEITTGGFVQDMTIESGELPDLTVTEKSEEWISLADGTYNVTCTVANIGTSGADASTTAIEINGTVVATDSVPALAIGESHTSIFGPFTLSGENDTIRVCADSGEGVISELNETNNCLENVLEAPSMPDLIVWIALKTPGYVNEDNILGVRVKNTGTIDAGSFSVSLAIDGTQVPEQTVTQLAAGETTEIEYAWTPTELGGHALSATVDTNNDVEESDETNNDLARTSVIIKPTDWHQFHYDEVHSGFSPSSAPNTNETLWISDELSAIGGTSTVVADGKVFAYGGPTSPYGSGEGVLYCLDEFTGAILWNISIPTPAYGSWSSPAYHNGRVFTSTDIEAGCYDATTGEQIWAFENPTNGPSVNGGPIVADGKVIVNDWQEGHYYCLDEETGELLWTFTEEQAGSWAVGYTQGVPAYEDGKFYLATWIYIGGNVYCVDADTGDVIWNQTTPLDTCGSPAVVDGTVYVTNYNFYGDGAIYAMDATDGAIRWSQTIQRSDSTPTVAYGNVYVTGGCLGFSERQTYCFDVATGDLVWETDTSDEMGAWTCSVAVADGKVFVGSEGGDFFDYAGTYALDAFTGDLIWSHPEGGSSPAVADNMVFTIGGGRVYAFYSEPQEPDLIVTAIKKPANLRNDVVNPITATIENIGGSSAGNFGVLLTVDDMTIDTATIATLGAGENVAVEFLWTPDATGGAALIVIADADNSIEELDETNNDLLEPVNVSPKLTVTTNVRIEGMNETVWTGDVTFSSSVLTATDGSTHYLNEPTALGALDCANTLGGFSYVVESHPTYGLYVSEVNNEPAILWDGWMYRVNYVSPWVGAADYTLTGSDEVLWYFGAWTAPPLAIELSATGVSPGEEFVATVTAYNGTSTAFEPVDNATVYADGLTFQTGIDGNATLSIDIAGDYMVYADKGTWADYTRSEKVYVFVDPLPAPPDTCDTRIILNNAPADSYAVIYGTSGKFTNGDMVNLPVGGNIQARGWDPEGVVYGSKVFKTADGSDLEIEFCDVEVILNNSANNSYAVIYGMSGKFADGDVLSLPVGGNVQARGWDSTGAIMGGKVFKKVDCTPFVIEFCDTEIVLNNSANGSYAVIYGMSGKFADGDVLNLPCAGRIQARGWNPEGTVNYGKVYKSVDGTPFVIEYP